MGKEKIANYFQEKQDHHENLFVPYIVAGDGGLDLLQERINFLEKSGVAAIELGIPFSDPVADGPTIQEASIRALENGTSLAGVLDVLEPTKDERKVPIILMTYLNPIYAYGIEKFAADCERVGVDGVIIPDVPLEEEEVIEASLTKHHIAFIRLAALTSTPDRIKEIARRSEGFLYAVSVTGTTGARTSHHERVATYLETLKKHSTVPVLAGFGVATANQAHELSSHCDGVIVGSKIVDLLHQGKEDEVRQLIVDSL
ncbi:tryptophan synthase subunit alpha [Pseudogracilibacillus auburnensis]|uniref:Tryptophan synthase alpha chain n=1 Tax=Pseudogracilibacillus auburnensis TaxID=1494959 RepID=A0A2V3VXM9_9BACI|nr:tryptophan synthase subunit alpha [Pseudogracilibacillus auburnensis]MBO1002273.1 tryptophan synthase subunit alpha [Pseudogracilibacillus auburnensis]PXW86340.1 tryptophan synthase alpha chain [Pseudogracilibacillus auburnensis]